jgi:hypothetical protein
MHTQNQEGSDLTCRLYVGTKGSGVVPATPTLCLMDIARDRVSNPDVTTYKAAKNIPNKQSLVVSYIYPLYSISGIASK